MASIGIESYMVGIICALPLERTAVELMLDETHAAIDTPYGDYNVYTYGRIGTHNVVIASLGFGTYGTVSAAGVANDLRRSFPHLKYTLMVGIGGGVPRLGRDGVDIRLGDIVVGCTNGAPTIINYTLGKDLSGAFEIRSQLGEPPDLLSRAVAALKTQHQISDPTYLHHLADMLEKKPWFNDPKLQEDYFNLLDTEDNLFAADTLHPAYEHDCSTCLNASIFRQPRYLRRHGLPDAKFIRKRQDGSADYPTVFFGSLGSADTLMKSGTRRDAVYAMIQQQRNAKILCFEMEASGIVKGWPCLVIRGICDYSDSHKNDHWQNFAAATAAAYAKDLLIRIRPNAVADTKSAVGFCKSPERQSLQEY